MVVEQIPEEYFSENAVQDFFSQFGDIVDVNMQAYKRLAIVQFADYYSARGAYDSPKVIFDNRFVKVYWYKPDTIPKPPAKNAKGVPNSAHQRPQSSTSHGQDEDMLDPGEIERRQAEAQKAFEDRQKKAPEIEARLGEIEMQMADIDKKLEENAEQKRLLKEALAMHGISHAEMNGDHDDSSSHEATLIDQLASLQKEAENLRTLAPRGQGQDVYRGRGSFRPRGRGSSTFRGGYRGRGGFVGTPFAGGRGGVKRWDNRPKRIAVARVAAGSKKDEALREHLLVSALDDPF